MPPRRLGLVFRPGGQDWQTSHAQCPFSQALPGSRYRVHFSTRDALNRSRGAWVDMDWRDGSLRIVNAATAPSLDLGGLGAFDDAGAMPSCLVADGPDLLLYYTGWTLGRTVPFMLSIGLACSTDGGASFQRVHESPVLGRNRHDPFLTASPWVIREGGDYRMWYVSGTRWEEDPAGGPPVHYYTIKHAISRDGLNWETSDHLCLPYDDDEHAIARPVVRAITGGYAMTYSARKRGSTYRIYAAHSADGLNWVRRAAPLLDVSCAGWDSEMVCYGARLFADNGPLLYNGNAYGRDGFGLAWPGA